MLIRADDTVVVKTGADKGEKQRVLRVLLGKGKVVVEKVNMVKKHVRPSQRNPQGGRLEKEMPVDVSNVMLHCARCDQGVRLGVRYLEDGVKERFCKKCGESQGPVSPPRARYAKK